MYDKAWITNVSAILTMLASVAGGASGQIGYDQAAAGFLAAGGLLGLGRKLEAIRQGIALAGKVAEATKPK
jgi:hypothetical protein